MRIIAGKYKSAKFDSPRTARTHPMSDRARGALFNVLGDLSGLSVFDPFAGTGALAFEALSRGASEVMMCELDMQAQQTIVSNMEKLQLPGLRFHRGNARSWVKRNKDERFDVVLADPPYDDIDRLLIQMIADKTKPDGVFVLSWPAREKALDFEGVELLQTNNYAGAKLLFFRRLGA